MSDKEFERFNEILSGFCADLMPHQIAVQLGIDLSRSILALSILSEKGISENLLLIYHNCDPSKVVEAIPFGKGFLKLPWICPDCEEEVSTYSDISFDLMAKIIEK